MSRFIGATVDSTMEDFKHSIKDWYRNGGKYVIKIVLKVVVLVAVIVITIVFPPSGFIAIIAAGVTLLDSAAEVKYSVDAYNSYKKDKNSVVADRIADKSGKELLQDRVENNNVKKIIGGVYTIASFAAIVQMGRDFKQGFKEISGNKFKSILSGTKFMFGYKEGVPFLKDVLKIKQNASKINITMRSIDALKIGKIAREIQTTKGLIDFPDLFPDTKESILDIYNGAKEVISGDDSPKIKPIRIPQLSY